MYRLAASLLVFVVIAASAQAQGVQVGPNGVRLLDFGEVDAKATVDRWSENERKRLSTALDLRVELLIHDCRITDAQVGKFRLLIKGIVHRRVSSGAEQLAKFMRESELVPEIKSDDRDFEPQDELLITGARLDKDFPGVVLFRTHFKEPLFEIPLWQDVLKSNLSETQYVQYERSCLERNQSLVSAALSQALAKLDELSCLNSAQHEMIKSEWQEAIAAKISIGYPTNLEEAFAITTPTVSDRTLVNKILTEKQLAALDIELEREHWRGVGWSTR